MLVRGVDKMLTIMTWVKSYYPAARNAAVEILEIDGSDAMVQLSEPSTGTN